MEDDPQVAEPIVSVVIPAYNAEHFILETLRSASNQSLRSIEILVVDDGSTDGTAALVQAYAQEDRRVRLIHRPNGGEAAARNTGLAAARGIYVAPLDADDVWNRYYLERQVAALEAAGPDAGLSYAWFVEIDREGRIINPARLKARGYTLTRRDQVVRRLMKHNFTGNGSSIVVRRCTAIEVGGYDASRHASGQSGCEDVDFCLAVALGHDFAVVPEVLVGYRKHPASVSQNSMKQLAAGLLVLDKFGGRPSEVPSLWLRPARSYRYASALTGALVERRLSAAAAITSRLRADPNSSVVLALCCYTPELLWVRLKRQANRFMAAPPPFFGAI